MRNKKIYHHRSTDKQRIDKHNRSSVIFYLFSPGLHRCLYIREEQTLFTQSLCDNIMFGKKQRNISKRLEKKKQMNSN